MNQSKLKAISCSLRKVRENICDVVMIDVGVTSGWMKKWCKFLSQLSSIVNVKPITFWHSIRKPLYNRPISIYIKILPKTIDLSTRLWRTTTVFVGFIPQSFMPRSVIVCWILICRSWSISPILTFSVILHSVTFKIYDLDNDGKISKDDLMQVCMFIMTRQVTTKFGVHLLFFTGNLL